MGFWDFLKKKKLVEKESINFGSLENWLKEKKQESKKQEKMYIGEIKEKLKRLAEDLEKEINALNQVDVGQKKAEDKVKLVVKENLENYTRQLEKLLEKIKGLALENIQDEKVIEKVNFTFSDFDKKSHLSFEKATFLIGEELGNVKQSISNFIRGMKNVLNENKDAIERLKVISIVEKKASLYLELEKNELEITNNIKERKEALNKINQQIKAKEEKIKSIKSSEKFLIENKKRELLKEKKENLEKEMANLRAIIDFKSLAGFYHIFEKEMALIKNYKEQFKESFKKTNGQDLLALLKEAKLEDQKIMSKVKDIEEKERDIESIVIEKTGIEETEEEIKELISKIERINSENEAEEKRAKKIQESLSEVKRSIKEEMEKLNVEIN